MKRMIFVVLVFLLAPFVFSFDCDSVGNSDYCEQVQSSNLENKDIVYSSLLYPESNIPKHQFIQEYNEDIDFSKPDESDFHNSNYIKNVWLSFSWLYPSVYVNDELYVTALTQAQSHYDYNVQLPSNYKASKYPKKSNGDCKREYSLNSNNAEIKYYFNDIFQNSGASSLLNVNSGEITSELEINVQVKIKHYEWKKKWKWWKFKKQWTCSYDHTSYSSDNIVITESKDVILYNKTPTWEVLIEDQYSDTTKGKYSVDNFSYFNLEFLDSSIIQQKYTYSVGFEKQPSYVAILKANPTDITKVDNLFLDGETFYLHNIDSCVVNVYDHFNEYTQQCQLEVSDVEQPPFQIKKKELDLDILFYVLMFMLVMYFIYKLLKSQMKKIFIPLFLILLLVPFAVADGGEEECGLTNLGSCIVDYLIDAILFIFNSALAPLLWLVQTLLTAEVNISLFYHFWSVIRYMLSFFYVFFIIYAGYTLLMSSANPIKRAHAKEVLTNLIIMIVLVQGSYYIYGLLIDISVNMSSVMIDMVDPDFFLLTADNIVNFGLQFLFALSYVIVLLLTVLLLVFRYVIVTLGLVFFPLGIFCYFTPPLRGQGQFILTLIGTMIFLPFFNMIIIYGCSLLLDVPIFQNFKILVMITAFSLVICSIVFAIKFAMGKAISGGVTGGIGKAIKYVGLML